MIVNELFKFLDKNNITISVAESMTAGNLQNLLTSVDGSSDYFEGGITAYNINQKVKHLGVNKKVAEKVDCVSQRVADQMALGCCKMFETRMSISTTGYVDKNLFFSVCLDNEIILRGERNTSVYQTRNVAKTSVPIDILITLIDHLKDEVQM